MLNNFVWKNFIAKSKRNVKSALLVTGLIVSVTVTAATFYVPAQGPWSELEELLFPKSSSDPFFTTDSLLIIKDGNTVYEKYWNGNTIHTSHITWSISKSISSLIVGTIIKKGDVELSDSLCKIAPQYLNKIDCSMTIEHLMEWSSGLSFLEAYESGGDRTYSSVGQMLYGDGKKDSVSFVLGHQQLYPPGTHYYYSTGDSSVLLGIFKNIYSKEVYKELPQKNLFDALGIRSAAFEQDSSGQFHGGSSLFMSARDLARVGELMLNSGKVNGHDLLPENFVEYLTTQNPQWKGSPAHDPWIPLRQWWTPDLKALGLDEDPTFPRDIIAARGHWGQYLVIVPSMNLVVVRYGLDLQGRLDVLEFMKRLVKSVRSL